MAVVGPTASGKTGLGLRLASEMSGAVVGADSLQVYRHFDIGSAKPSPQMMRAVPHFMTDILLPDEQFNAGKYAAQAAPILEKLCAGQVLPIVTGGTFLYVRALLDGLIENPSDPLMRRQIEDDEKNYGTQWLYERLKDADPVSASGIHRNDSVRIRRALEIFHSCGTAASEVRHGHGFPGRGFDCLKIGLATDRETLVETINRRTEKMFENGIVEETEKIRKMGYSSDLKPMKAIGYRQANLLIDGKVTRREAVETVSAETRKLAKRQMTWLRKEKDVRWFSVQNLSEAVVECRRFLETD